MVVKLVTFEGDGTLWDSEAAARRGLEAAMKMLEQTIPEVARRISVVRLQEIRDDLASRVTPEVRDGGIEWGEKARLDSFSEALEEVGHRDEDLASKLAATYFSYRWNPAEVFPDVTPTLEAIRDKYMLAVLTDGRGSLDATGLASYFEFVITSPEAGSRKPRPEMFELATGKAQCEPSQMVHVGDSLKRDVGGAKTFGAKGVWLNRFQIERPARLDPDAEVQFLTDLPPILSHW